MSFRKREPRIGRIGKLSGKGTCFLALNCFAVLVLFVHHKQLALLNKRSLSTDLGNGNCQWEAAEPMGSEVESFGTLIASYPASGMRFTWQQAEGLSGIQVGDDYRLGGDGVYDKTGLLKTQYPHKEGIWSWGQDMSQAILLIRNPRWAIPSYHALLSEIHFSLKWPTSFLYISNTFTSRPPIEEWVNWRDYRFEEEIKLWRWHIDFWMEGGTQYWSDNDFERCGQHPFEYLDETDRTNWPRDNHCPADMNCEAKAVVSYETMKDPITGPVELSKIAQLIRGKEGFPKVVGDEAIQCVWEATNTNRAGPDIVGPAIESFTFTTDQFSTMKENLQFMINKYSTDYWATNPLAQDLVVYFNSYMDEVTADLNELIANPTPEPTYDANREEELKGWYNTLGRGNRYAKEKVEGMSGFWPFVSQLYDESSTFTTPDVSVSLTGDSKEWLDAHNARRKAYQEAYDFSKAYTPMKWSSDLANSAQEYAQLLIDELPCEIQHGYQGNSYGGENLALSGGTSSEAADPNDILEYWANSEANLGYSENGHFRQVVWRATEHVGCGEVSKAHYFTQQGYQGYCHIQVCRYLRPGNCNINNENWEEQTYAETSPCGPTCPSNGCFDVSEVAAPTTEATAAAAAQFATPAATQVTAQAAIPSTVNSAQWLNVHNTRRKAYQEAYDSSKLYTPLKWSNDLASSAQAYAQLLIDELDCSIQHGFQGNTYGGENLALKGGTSSDALEPEDTLQRWTNNEANLGYSENGHFRQVVW
eukprot:CAMPEP_0198276072 /NCGR_PEP_ID=MMETSP1447-20131203/65115_1 /TAXON_ID=420782 /ORGANISM="Chaetoceros dichaeta, Strain CCMP1751" /LENGTH=759 /DNA_ID=CAMNT_0043970991 /DNA_START=1 /DNA_END=2277 /DNA_ORIENTATION=-